MHGSTVSCYKRLEIIVAKVARNCSTRIYCFFFRLRHAIPRGYNHVVNVGVEFDAQSQILEDDPGNPDNDIANLDDLPLPSDYHLENLIITKSTAEYALTMNPAYLGAKHGALVMPAMAAQQGFEMNLANLAARQRALAMNPDYAMAMEAKLDASSMNPAYLGAQHDALVMSAQQGFEINPADLAAHQRALAMNPDYALAMDAHQRALAMNPDYALAMEAHQRALAMNSAYLAAQQNGLAMSAHVHNSAIISKI